MVTVNRLGSATSPYLRQHADNPVDWWPWCDEAFAEARRRDVPILLSVGYAACHWCHVMAHESFEDDERRGGDERATSSTSRSTARSGPDVDAVYMDATTALTGQGGWPMTCLLDARRRTVLRRHALPARRSSCSCSPRSREAWQRATATRSLRGRAADRRRARRSRAYRESGDGRLPTDGRPRPAAAARLDPQFDREQRRASAGRRSSRRRWCSSSCCASTSAPATRRRWRMAEQTFEAMARGGMYDQLGRRVRAVLRRRAPGSCRTSRRCSTTTRCCCAVYLHWWRLYRLPLAERVARETARLPAARPAARPRAGSRRRSTPTPTASRG